MFYCNHTPMVAALGTGVGRSTPPPPGSTPPIEVPVTTDPSPATPPPHVRRKRRPAHRGGGGRSARGLAIGRAASREPWPGLSRAEEPVLSRVEGQRPLAERKPRFYSALADRDDWELSWLAEPSLAQEMGLLRLRVAEMLTDSRADWRLTLRSIEVLVRMARVQQGLPPNEDGAADPFAELGKTLERLFAPGPGEPRMVDSSRLIDPPL
jgi:hypothetical protein